MATKKTVPIKASNGKSSPEQDPSIIHYEAALKLIHERKYDRARDSLHKLLEGSAPQHICDRARAHLNACEAKLADSKPAARTVEEQYDYAVVLMNQGRSEDARTALDKLVKSSPDADFAHYGLALLHCSAGRGEEALRHLQRAIELNARNRIQARNDGDFQNMADDPRFTELLYPEAAADMASPQWRS
jgi:tetratricopeptide (TPR) repeat protein